MVRDVIRRANGYCDPDLTVTESNPRRSCKTLQQFTFWTH